MNPAAVPGGPEIGEKALDVLRHQNSAANPLLGGLRGTTKDFFLTGQKAGSVNAAEAGSNNECVNPFRGMNLVPS